MGFRVQGLKFRIVGEALMGVGCLVSVFAPIPSIHENVGCGVWGVGCGVWGVGCGVWGVGCGVWGLGCGI